MLSSFKGFERDPSGYWLHEKFSFEIGEKIRFVRFNLWNHDLRFYRSEKLSVQVLRNGQLNQTIDFEFGQSMNPVLVEALGRNGERTEITLISSTTLNPEVAKLDQGLGISVHLSGFKEYAEQEAFFDGVDVFHATFKRDVTGAKFAAVSGQFAPVPRRHNVFINTLPRSGTHLLSNLMTGFLGFASTYPSLISNRINAIPGPTTLDHSFFTNLRPTLNQYGLHYGHIRWTPSAAVFLKSFKTIQLIRDPYSQIISLASLFLEPYSRVNGPVGYYVQKNKLNLFDVVKLLLHGSDEHPHISSAQQIIQETSVQWLSAGHHVLRFEDLISAVKNVDGAGAKDFFAAIFDAIETPLPDDWKRRVATLSAFELSHTIASKTNKLSWGDIPEALKFAIRNELAMVRKQLGYGDAPEPR
jgi:hypothetical protein